MSKLRLIASTNRLTHFNRLLENTKSVRWMSSVKTEDQITHTGQHWDANDYRMVRYVNKSKLVNKNIAMNLINEIPPKICTERVVWCDGGSGPTGHPRVYINLDKPGNHICGYCGLRFELDDCHDH